MPESYELSSAECEDLLRAGVTGRMAVSAPDGPHIIPVNYSVVDGAIIVRTSPYSLLGTKGPDAPVAFEVDRFDQVHQRGWSVQARGRCEAVEDSEDIARIMSVWSPRPWASGVRSLFLGLPWAELSGRRLGRDWDPVDELRVQRAL